MILTPLSTLASILSTRLNRNEEVVFPTFWSVTRNGCPHLAKCFCYLGPGGLAARHFYSFAVYVCGTLCWFGFFSRLLYCWFSIQTLCWLSNYSSKARFSLLVLVVNTTWLLRASKVRLTQMLHEFFSVEHHQWEIWVPLGWYCSIPAVSIGLKFTLQLNVASLKGLSSVRHPV